MRRGDLMVAFAGTPQERHAVPREADLLLDGTNIEPLAALCGAVVPTGFCSGADYWEPDHGAATDCVSCRNIAEGRDPEFEAARARAVAAVKAARAAIDAMLELLDSTSGRHDDVADLIMVVNLLGLVAREAKPDMEHNVIAWLLSNEGGVRSVRVGEFKYWGEKEKSVRCLDVGEAGRAAAMALHHEDILRIVFGDEEAAESIFNLIRTLFNKVVSSSGLKEGATRDALMDAAELRLRAEHAADPAVVEVGDGETPAEALARAVEAAREAAFLAHFEETWPDKMKGGEPKTKLGVANLRFVHRRGGGTKAELEEMERRRIAEVVT